MASQVENIKWVPGTRFIVDGFKFTSPECRRYFLTHAHSDHTVGLSQAFAAGIIYCSTVTYNLLVHDMGINPNVLRPLELNVTINIDGVEVTPLEANHCPGACCFLFNIPSTTPEGGPPTSVLHTGDFRWCSEQHGKHPLLVNGIDILMLDTTYCTPKWTFPHQDESIQIMADALLEQAQAHPATLFVCMSYHIGKERAYFGAALRLGWKIWAPPAKRKVLRLLNLPAEWMSLLVDSPEAAQLHVLGGGDQLHTQSLEDRIKCTQWTRVVLMRPTGWNYRPSGKLNIRDEGNVITIGVPYSEHSSFTELQDCVKTLRPKRLIPTVNAGDSAKARVLVDRLCGLMDLSEDKTRLDAYFFSNSKNSDSTGIQKGTNRVSGEESFSPKAVEKNTQTTRDMVFNTLIAASNAVGGGSSRIERPRHSQQQRQQRQEGREGEVIDLEAVDVEEQQRLWDQLVQSQGHLEGAKRPAAQSSVDSAAKKKQQISIRDFFSK